MTVDAERRSQIVVDVDSEEGGWRELKETGADHLSYKMFCEKSFRMQPAHA